MFGWEVDGQRSLMRRFFHIWSFVFHKFISVVTMYRCAKGVRRRTSCLADPGDAGRRVVGEAAGEALAGARAAAGAAAARRNKQVMPEVLGKWVENRMGVAEGVHGAGQVMVKALDGFSDRVSGFLGGVTSPPRIVFLVLVNRLQFALDLGLDRPELGFVVEDGFQLLLLAPERPGGP